MYVITTDPNTHSRSLDGMQKSRVDVEGPSSTRLWFQGFENREILQGNFLVASRIFVDIVHSRIVQLGDRNSRLRVAGVGNLAAAKVKGNVVEGTAAI